jgi:hypothetical protein
MTRHEAIMAEYKERAKKAGKPLGPKAQVAADQRPADYCELAPQAQWEVDSRLGLLDWDGEWYT